MRNILDVADARPRLRRADDAATAKSAACRSATRRRARCSGWCCRRTRPACTRCGCRSSRCRSASCSSPVRRSRGRRTAWPRRSSRPAFRARRSRSIPGWATSAPRCSTRCARSLIFGGTPTVDRYRGNPRVQAHGPGFSKILLGDDQVDDWEKYLDMMVDSVFVNSGRGCINCSGIWASRHTREIADAHRAAAGGRPAAAAGASRRQRWRRSPCPGVADAISQAIDAGSAGARRHRRHGAVSRRRRASSRTGAPITCCRRSSTASRRTRPSRRRNTCSRSSRSSSVPKAQMLEAIGPTLVCTRDHLQRRSSGGRCSTPCTSTG